MLTYTIGINDFIAAIYLFLRADLNIVFYYTIHEARYLIYCSVGLLLYTIFSARFLKRSADTHLCPSLRFFWSIFIFRFAWCGERGDLKWCARGTCTGLPASWRHEPRCSGPQSTGSATPATIPGQPGTEYGTRPDHRHPGLSVLTLIPDYLLHSGSSHPIGLR